ncbi:hypothetical protein BMH32_01180 [Leucobacter sp. OLJS4]|uniref:hypothetical protein n=1 Tax=Leucobacter sp. OLJS4 TaxID=1914922 RepID=UPI000C190443|nr:hypothetical protein [Leucobacter sp. OLJS4]PIJ13937.1 hypothetical protein BMH32_01180 [Leucobacter sp. OLJS4]
MAESIVIDQKGPAAKSIRVSSEFPDPAPPSDGAVSLGAGEDEDPAVDDRGCAPSTPATRNTPRAITSRSASAPAPIPIQAPTGSRRTAEGGGP